MLRPRGNLDDRFLVLPDRCRVKCSRLDSADEVWLASDRRKVRNPYSGAMVAGDAQVTFEGREHLDLAREHRALDLATRVNRKPVLSSDALSDLAPHNFALADLCARPSRGLALAGAENELGGRRRGESRGLVVAVYGAKLGNGLKAEHGAEATFASAHNERFEFGLTL